MNSTVTMRNVSTTGELAIAISVTQSTVEAGNVTAEKGIGVMATENSEVTAGTVEGDSGIMANGSTVTAESVTATDGMGVRAEDGSTVKVGTTDEAGNFTAGDVKSENGIGIKADGGSTVTAGEVTGVTAGIKADGGTVTAENVTATNGDGVKVEGPASVTIDGTLTVTGGTPILLGDTVTETDAGNINITVWEIQGQTEDGSVVSGGQGDAAKAVHDSINFIVKIAPDETSQSVFGGYHAGDTINSGKQQIKVTVVSIK